MEQSTRCTYILDRQQEWVTQDAGFFLLALFRRNLIEMINRRNFINSNLY